MDTIRNFLYELIANYGIWGLALMLISLMLFFVQFYYYMAYYAVIPRYRNSSRGGTPVAGNAGGISVVALLGDNEWYLENTLPKLLAQDYAEFEIVIVEVGTSEDFSDGLAVLRKRFPNLVTTRMDYDPRFPISDKMAYNVGIKAASYDNIVLTTEDSAPVSAKWLSCLAKGFANGKVVIGYCGIRPGSGLANRMMRCSRLMLSVRYLASAIRKHPYRGIIQNLGFTRELYFGNKGFSHLNMNLGEDDLFVQCIATGENTSVIMNPHATVMQEQWGGLGWWWDKCKFYRAALRYYPAWAKNRNEWELGSRLLFYFTIVAMAVIMPVEVKVGAVALWLIRSVIVRYKIWRVRRRLGERGLGWAMTFYDLTEPFSELWLSVMSRLRPAPGIWR